MYGKIKLTRITTSIENSLRMFKELIWVNVSTDIDTDLIDRLMKETGKTPQLIRCFSTKSKRTTNTVKAKCTCF